MEKLYADIIVDISQEKLDRPFQYRVPAGLREKLEPGMCVVVPFGKGSRLIKGYVVGVGDICKFAPERMKEIQGIVKNAADIDGRMIALAGWIRENYGSTMIQALKTVLPARQSVKKLEHRTIQRVLGKEEIISLLGESRRKKQVAKERLLRELSEQETLPYEWVTGKLGVSAQTVKALERAGAVRILSSQSLRNPIKLQNREENRPALSQAQTGIVEEVLADFDGGRRETYLLHGITGSGKTEVYMRLAEEMVKRGRQAIVLIPEIALTYQTLLRFFRRFGDRVSVMNSSLTPGEKYDQCQRAKNGEIDVIIGPRSALFTPFPNIGLIIIDEEHENSYKSEAAPKYHARETALEVARLHGASVLLGSATPSLEAYYRAETGEYKLFTLKERLTGGQLPRTYIVDLRRELREGNRSIFSRKLQELLADRLAKGEQSILFLNRRGYAGFVSCRSCGQVMKCPHCDVSLSEHMGGMPGGSGGAVRMQAGPGQEMPAEGGGFVRMQAGPGQEMPAEGGFVRMQAGSGQSMPAGNSAWDDRNRQRPGLLICHYCGYMQERPRLCPQCGSRYISGFKAGTQQTEEKLRELFPQVRTLRMDADTTRTKESYEKILSAFSNGEADVLIGTQMIVKGHDFPRVTLVGVLAADLSLNMGDYRAGERTFQLLTQAVGRAGRGKLPGEAVIQTYQPEHYAILRAAGQDYEGFYGEEILYREMMGYPPVSHMLAVQIFSGEEESGKRLAESLAALAGRRGAAGNAFSRLRAADRAVQGSPGAGGAGRGLEEAEPQVIGPAPASISRINDIFRFVFYVKCAKYDKLIRIKDRLEEEMQRRQEELPRAGEAVQFDFNPVNTL